MKFLILVIVGMLSVSNSYADRITDLIEAKCLKCHDSNQPDDRFPSLGAQTPEFLFVSMKAYKTGDRNNRIGVRMMKNRVKFDDATLMAIAEYYSQTPAPAAVAGDPVLMAEGKELYNRGVKARGIPACFSCHGKKGEGDAENSRVAGQYDWYLSNQMYWYKTGEIKNADMIDIARKLTNKEVEALSVYMQSL